MEKKREENSHIVRDWAKKGEGSVPPAKNQAKWRNFSLSYYKRDKWYDYTCDQPLSKLRIFGCFRLFQFKRFSLIAI